MKKILAVCVLMLPLFSQAQVPNDMMQRAQEMQVCMQNLDQAELQRLEKASLNLQSELKSLCAAGKSSEAKQRAINFSKTVVQSKALAQMRKCTKIMEGLIPEIPYDKMVEDYSKQNINLCDHL